MDNKLSFEKLNNDNYFTWKYRTEMLLKKEKVWKTITETQPGATEAAALTNWLEKDEKAMAIIGLSVADNQLQHIRNSTTAKESWTSLKSFHEQNTLVNTTTLMRKLWDLKLSEDTNPQTHIQDMTNTLQKLVDLGEPDLTEKWKTSILISSLPECYHTLVTALEARDPSTLTFALVQSKIIDEFTRKNSQTQSDDQILKLQGDNKISCAYCKEPNHTIDECFSLKRMKNAQRKQNRYNQRKHPNSSRVNCIEQKDSDNESLFTLNENKTDQSILDSGATSHASNQKALFNSLDENFQTTIKVANGIRTKIYGKGECTIKLKNERGQETTLKMKVVLYSADLDGTFISIKRLCKDGYEVHFHDKIGEIMKNGKQIAIAPLANDLYTVKLEKVYSLSNSNRCIHDWHRIFGHRYLIAVKEMIKNNNLNVIKCTCIKKPT